MEAVARDLVIAPPVKENEGTSIVPLPHAEPADVGALTRRMKAGDEQAFTFFHERYCDRLFRYLFVLCRGDEPLARDLLQATMLKVVRSIRVFDEGDRFWNWLAAIARNAFLDHVRKLRRLPQLHFLSPDENASLAAPQESDADAALLAALEHALADLTSEDRALVETFYFQTGSYASLASEQGTSPKAIESRLTRVRQKLRTAIQAHLRYENS